MSGSGYRNMSCPRLHAKDDELYHTIDPVCLCHSAYSAIDLFETDGLTVYSDLMKSFMLTGLKSALFADIISPYGISRSGCIATSFIRDFMSAEEYPSVF